MEKIYLKPVSQEILIKGASSEGHLDVFSYDPADENGKKLGSIFIIGHVHHETDDVAYSVNLIASLAKREYYAKPNLAPRDAFTATLKKVNEVVEDFFEHEGLKLNIGIFAVAGENIYLSKLGKFKILLGRGERAIDVLNNVDLFDKEVTDEKQFSSIISGKVTEKDRVLAFYPSRTMTAREKYFKADLLALTPKDFVQKLNAIKEEKDSFACAAVYIDLHKVREIASAPRIEPHETPVRLAGASPKPKPVQTSTKDNTPPTQDPDRAYASPAALAHAESQTYILPEQEMPKIIPTEFSLGKKGSVFGSAWNRIRFINLTPRNKAILSFGLAALIIGVSFAVKAVFVPNPEAKQLQAAIENARMNIQLARTKVSQQDMTGARTTLNTSLASIASLANADASKTDPVRNEILALLDELDQAQEVSPAFVAQVPAEYGKIALLAGAENVFVYAYNQDAKAGIIAKVHNETIDEEHTTPDVNASLMFATKEYASVVDLSASRIVTWGPEETKSASFKIPEGTTSMYLYEDNMYLVNANNIHKIADVPKGGASKPWLADGQTMIADPALVAVDGDIYVMSKSGILAKYYKGKKQSETNTGLIINENQLFITTNEGTSLYLVDKQMRRIYILDKKTGTLTRTLKIDSAEPLVAAAVDNTGSVYFTTSDNKIWKVQ